MPLLLVLGAVAEGGRGGQAFRVGIQAWVGLPLLVLSVLPSMLSGVRACRGGGLACWAGAALRLRLVKRVTGSMGVRVWALLWKARGLAVVAAPAGVGMVRVGRQRQWRLLPRAGGGADRLGRRGGPCCGGRPVRARMRAGGRVCECVCVRASSTCLH